MLLIIFIYLLVSMGWIGVCINRADILPRTKGDLILTFISLPFVIATLFAHTLKNSFEHSKIPKHLKENHKTKDSVEKLINYWNKEL